MKSNSKLTLRYKAQNIIENKQNNNTKIEHD